jgi:hypothetical protein
MMYDSCEAAARPTRARVLAVLIPTSFVLLREFLVGLRPKPRRCYRPELSSYHSKNRPATPLADDIATCFISARPLIWPVFAVPGLRRQLADLGGRRWLARRAISASRRNKKVGRKLSISRASSPNDPAPLSIPAKVRFEFANGVLASVGDTGSL